MTNDVFFTRGRRDTAFTDDFHPFTQVRCQFQRLAKRRFALIATINISMVHGGHAEIQMLFNKTDQLAGGHIPVHQSPVAHHKTGKLRALRRNSNTLNHNRFLLSDMRGVYARLGSKE